MRDGGCGYVVVVIGLLAKVSLRHVVFSVIQLLVKSLWHRTKVAMGLKKCCRVVSSFAAEVRRLCCRVVISLKLSCSRSFEKQVEYDTELSHFTLVIIAVSAEELTFCMFFRILILFTFSRLRHK